jgi:hypothetical protein
LASNHPLDDQVCAHHRSITHYPNPAVCFIRNVFPSDAFEKLQFGSTEVRALKKASSQMNEEALKLKEMEDSAYEALGKGYLK